MSYEHCEKHNEDATNGCVRCDGERRWDLVEKIVAHLDGLPTEDLRALLRHLDFQTLGNLEHILQPSKR